MGSALDGNIVADGEKTRGYELFPMQYAKSPPDVPVDLKMRVASAVMGKFEHRSVGVRERKRRCRSRFDGHIVNREVGHMREPCTGRGSDSKVFENKVPNGILRRTNDRNRGGGA